MAHGDSTDGGTNGMGETRAIPAPAHEPMAGADAGGAPSGWLDRLALRGRRAMPSAEDGGDVGALRPRLPYPFEAMKFAHDEAAPPPRHALGWPRTDALDTGVPEPAARSPAAGQAAPMPDAGPARAFVTASTAAPGAHAVARSVDAAPAGSMRAPGTPHPPSPPGVAAMPPARATVSDGQPVPRATPPAGTRWDDDPPPSRPAYPAPAAPLAASAAPASVSARHDAGMPRAALPAVRAPDAAAPWPAPAGTAAAPMPPLTATAAPRPARETTGASLRSAAVLQPPLPAGPAHGGAPEITIDVQIGRIDVRAPAGAPAATAPAPAPARGADPLQAYLARRGRGARS